jgi:hypothetical protein
LLVSNRQRRIARLVGGTGVARGGAIVDTGPLTRKRMETIDDKTPSAALDFNDRETKATKPFF